MPVATTDATAASDADKPLLVELASLAKDPAQEPVSVENIVVGSIDTSDDSSGSALIVKDAKGNLVVIYTSVLADGATATVPISFSASDGIATDADGKLTVTFTGTGADTVSLTLAQAKLLISAGYDTFAEIGGNIAGFTLLGKVETLTAIEATDLDALVLLGVTTVDATEDEMTLSVAQVQVIRDAGIHFADADKVTMIGKDTVIAALSAEEIAAIADDFVDRIDVKDGSITLDYARIEAFADAGLSFVRGDLVTLGDSSATVFALQAESLETVASLGVKTIDVTEKRATASASVFTDIADAGLTFAKDDKLIMSTSVPEVEAMTNKQLARFADIGVDYLDFYTYDGPRLVTKAFLDRIDKAGLKLLDPDELVIPTLKKDTLNGTSADERIDGLAGDDTIDGKDGNDTIIGNLGDDTLTGNWGADSLEGGDGNDKMTGGFGNDKFVFKSGSDHDIITDFAAGTSSEQDLIDVRRYTFVESFSDLKLKTDGDDVIVTFERGSFVRLQGVSINDIDATDFMI